MVEPDLGVDFEEGSGFAAIESEEVDNIGYYY